MHKCTVSTGRKSSGFFVAFRRSRMPKNHGNEFLLNSMALRDILTNDPHVHSIAFNIGSDSDLACRHIESQFSHPDAIDTRIFFDI
jgi:hypothetical protein